jgi:hypothetical protein
MHEWNYVITFKVQPFTVNARNVRMDTGAKGAPKASLEQTVCVSKGIPAKECAPPPAFQPPQCW